MDSKAIYIRPFKDCDLLGLTELLNDLENQQLVGGSLKTMSEAEVLSWLNFNYSPLEHFLIGPALVQKIL